jgi:hypothetical protein
LIVLAANRLPSDRENEVNDHFAYKFTYRPKEFPRSASHS